MPRALCCQFCRSELDPAQEFAYHVEAQTVHNPVMMAAIRRLPHAAGRPLRVCRGCQAGVERGQVRPPAPASVRNGHALLTAVAAVGMWALTAKLASILTDGTS